MEYIKLTSENINETVKKIEDFLTVSKASKKEILRITLSLEEALLRYKEKFGEEQEFSIKLGKFYRTAKIVLYVSGDSFDPYRNTKNADMDNAFMRNAMSNLGKLPLWKYTNKHNKLDFKVQIGKPTKDYQKLLYAIVLAFISGYIIRTLPFEIQNIVTFQILSPVLDKFIGFLNAVATPMIFISVVWGIYSIGDANTFSTIGKRLTSNIFIKMLIIVPVVCAASLFFLNLTFGTGSGTGNFGALYQMVLDIVPANIFIPFAKGNTLQLLFLGILFGVSLIVVGEKSLAIATLAEQLNYVMQTLIEVIGKIVPFYIFGSVLNLIITSEWSNMLKSMNFFISTMAGCMVIIIISILYTCIKHKVKPVIFIKKAFPTFLIALSTASSSACFNESLRTCIDDYGVDTSYSNFGVAFSQILFKPGLAIAFFMAAVCSAEDQALEINAIWVCTAIIMSIILATATPTVSGGSTASFSVLFAQLGLATNNIGIIIALNIILDFFHTPTNILCDQSMIIDTAVKEDLIDIEILRRDKA